MHSPQTDSFAAKGRFPRFAGVNTCLAQMRRASRSDSSANQVTRARLSLHMSHRWCFWFWVRAAAIHMSHRWCFWFWARGGYTHVAPLVLLVLGAWRLYTCRTAGAFGFGSARRLYTCRTAGAFGFGSARRLYTCRTAGAKDSEKTIPFVSGNLGSTLAM